jgi:1-acyl-sn-glycerol-3-phosphate acyltransferase
MPGSESPQVRRDRITAVVIAALVCLALPTATLLVSGTPPTELEQARALSWFISSAIVGAVLPFFYWGPYRAYGLACYASLAWLAVTVFGVLSGDWPGLPSGLALGLIVGGIARARRGPEPIVDNYLLAAGVLVGLMLGWSFLGATGPHPAVRYYLLFIAILLCGWCWTRLFRPAFEISLEPVLWLLYKLQARGAGLARFPRTGPCIIIANHACWLDPLFLAKVFPRPVTPMMTSRFYNLPVLRRLMVAFGVISVSEKAIKKETPEIEQAIAALDRGECLVIFPEGYLRRTEEQPLRRFGQGIWQILQARPGTPVFACWIEGGWGSYTSYYQGPPTKNKKLDLRRPIGVGISEGTVLPADHLDDHLRTRFHLMNLVIAARAHLGLPALPAYVPPTREEEKTEENLVAERTTL